MAKRKADESMDTPPQPKKGHRGKWSREDHGPDEDFVAFSYFPKNQHASMSETFDFITPTSLKNNTPNNDHDEATPQKRRGRKPGTKMPPKTKEKVKSGCQCFTPHESSYRCQLEEKFGDYCGICSK